ncbi:hypothetical protein [Nostoc sp. DSM 114167]|uniref:hypothetical protein n=1 Tax=Nostoc sp. DSM 114167 TaxID=3439050 RepID=UPI00404572A0
MKKRISVEKYSAVISIIICCDNRIVWRQVCAEEPLKGCLVVADEIQTRIRRSQ